MTNYRSLLHRVRVSLTFVASLFAVSALAAGQSEWLVYSFPPIVHSVSAGCHPQGSLVADSAGNLYGVTQDCGLGGTGVGTVFELIRPVPPSKQWTETVLYNFTVGGIDGIYPGAGLIFDSAGNLYGTTTRGGAYNNGTVFELTSPATEGGQWSETLLYSFKGGTSDGAGPSGGVVFDHSGNLYGTTSFGGTSIVQYEICFSGCGVAYELTPPGAPGGAWTETVLNHFYPKQRALFPVGTPVLDAEGNLYGATQGGSLGGEFKGGATYRLSPPSTPGGAWTYKLLYPADGRFFMPLSGLTLRRGHLFGTTAQDAPDYSGTAFELVPGPGPWTENVLHVFGSGSDGVYPYANMIFDRAGNLYGTTWFGGAGGDSVSCNHIGCGTVFKLAPPATEGGAWMETILHSFPPVSTNGSSDDGYQPTSGLFLAKDDVLFGVTSSAGKWGEGVVYGVLP